MAPPHSGELIGLIQAYGAKGILLDTNILLMYLIGLLDPERIPAFKRTKIFTTKDHRFLTEFLTHFRAIVVSPFLLTEVSNLAGALGEPDREDCFRSFAAFIQATDEQSLPSRQIALTPKFVHLGLTDASISDIARDRFLVLTDDLPLYAQLARDGVAAINFNHIRFLGW